MKLQKPTAFISAGALLHNLSVVRERVAPAQVMAVIKDDAYGHSQDVVLDILVGAGVARFGTLDLPSSLRLRGRNSEAMIFAWVIDSDDDVASAIRAGIDLAVTDIAMLERVAREAASISGTALVHLKIDSGLHRAGTLPEQWPALLARAAELQRAGVVTIVGLWTHLSEASEAEDSRSIAIFTAAVHTAQQFGIDGVVKHVAASAASFSRDDARYDMVRVGAFLYGIGPGDGIGPAELGLVPVMTLCAPVLALVQRDGKSFAEIALGGATGLLAEAAGAASVAIGHRRYLIDTVGVTRSLIDLSTADPRGTVRVGDTVQVGDTVTLFGSGAAGEPTLQEWADAMGTIGEELVCRVSALIPRERAV